MEEFESCSGDISFPTKATSTQYPQMQESMENGMDVISQHLEWNGNDKSKGSCAVTLFRQASEWIQQQKPVLMAFHAASLQVRDIIVHRFQHTWPIVCTWLLRLGRLFLILFILWLDCCLRGMDSFLQWWMSILLCGYLVQLSYLHSNGTIFNVLPSLVISHTQQ